MATDYALQMKELAQEHVAEPVLAAGRFTALQRHFETMLADWVSQGRRPEHMDMPHLQDTALFEWLFADEVLDIVESIVGPDIALWSSHFISKPPRTGKRVGWHEDSSYWAKSLDPMDVVTVWLAIDPATRDNGCMRVIPRTHHNGYSEYVTSSDQESTVFGNEIVGEQVDESKAVDCILAPNQCSLHHAKLVHGSEANTSDTRRCGYTMRYFSTSARFSEERLHAGHRIFLARGRDRAGNGYGDPREPKRVIDGNEAAAVLASKPVTAGAWAAARTN